MADFSSSLPIRTNQPGDVVIQLVDGTQPGRSLKVNEDGSINVANNSLFTKPFDKILILSKTDEGDPLQIKSQLNSIDMQLVTIVYDEDGDLQSIQVSDY